MNIPAFVSNSLVFVVLLISANSCGNSIPDADLILTNAVIWTGNEQRPWAEAMAVSGDTILSIGKSEDILKLRGEGTEEINLSGHFVAPGFIDTHVHLIEGGFNLSSVQLRDAKTPEEFSRRIGEFAKTVPPGTWILGGEWDGSDWETLPEKEWIDAFTPEHPVFVSRLDGHMALANSQAMEMAGVDETVKDVAGGTIIRNESDELTGIFKDNAMLLITSKIPSASDEQLDRALSAAMKYFASNGVTSVHNVWYPTDSEGHMGALKRAHKDGKLITRIFALGSLAEWSARAETIRREGPGDHWLRIKGLKGVLDGSLGSHTAAFFDPFSDAPSDSGLLMLSQEELYDWVSNADKSDIQVAVHAIGDRAINILLNTFARVQSENGLEDRRFRVEHAQHIHPADVSRFAELNVIPSMQPYHAIDDGRWAENVIGPERIRTTYAFKSLLDSGAKVAFGSDWPVAPASPLAGIYAAVTRRTLDNSNPGGWVPEQKITVEQALACYTKNAAYASFEEHIKGTLEAGKLADFVIISEDITKIDPVRIKDLEIVQTYVGGKKIYDKNSQ